MGEERGGGRREGEVGEEEKEEEVEEEVGKEVGREEEVGEEVRNRNALMAMELDDTGGNTRPRGDRARQCAHPRHHSVSPTNR